MTNRDPIEINGRIWTYDPTTSTHRPTDTKAASDNATGKIADVELPPRGKPLGAGKGAAFNSQVDLTIVHYRSRLADPDGISVKAAIDGLVMCGILADDSAKEIREIRQRQVKVKNASEEKTEIVIEEIN